MRFLASVSFLIFLSLFVGCGPGRNHFDSAEWKVSTQDQRRQVVLDLLERKLAIGKDRSEVIDLLGEPDVSEPDWFKYYIGRPIPGISDQVFVLVDFDKSSGKATLVSIADD